MVDLSVPNEALTLVLTQQQNDQSIKHFLIICFVCKYQWHLNPSYDAHVSELIHFMVALISLF